MFKTLLVSLISFGLLVSANVGMAATHAKINAEIPAKYKSSAGKVDINTIDEADLIKVKGIGAKRAANIVAYREKRGPFKSLEDLTSVKGIGPKLLEKVRAELDVR